MTVTVITTAAITYDIRSLRNKANPDDTFEAQLFYGDLKAIVKTSHLVKIDYPKFIVQGKKGSFINYGIDQQETSLKANIMPGEPGFAAEDVYKRQVMTTGRFASSR